MQQEIQKRKHKKLYKAYVEVHTCELEFIDNENTKLIKPTGNDIHN